MKLLKRKSSFALAALFVALLALPGFLSLKSDTVEARVEPGAAAQRQGRNDVKTKARNPQPHIPTGTAPANDNCANAIAVTAANCPFTDTKSTTGAGDETGEPLSTCTDQFNSVWYTFTTGANGAQVTVSTCTSNFDTAIMVYKVGGGACDFANFTPVACNDDFCGDGLQSTIEFLADPNSVYKIQVGGFDGETGTLTTNITCEELSCAPIVVNGTLGSGSPDYPSVTGTQTPARLFRDGIGSTCAVPKTCPGPFGSGSFTFDAYTFTNENDSTVCVTVQFDPNTGANPAGVNVHAITYLNTYSPTALCTNYLGDVGSSDTLPYSFEVPAGANFVIVICANNSGVGVGQTYKFTVVGNICPGFDVCIQQDAPKRFLEINSTSGAYRYTDCSKNIVRTGTGSASTFFCKINYSGSGPNSSATALANPCTKRGDATIVVPQGSTTQVVKIVDTNITNNDCQCAPAAPARVGN
jgi:hypothetical protein